MLLLVTEELKILNVDRLLYSFCSKYVFVAKACYGHSLELIFDSSFALLFFILFFCLGCMVHIYLFIYLLYGYQFYFVNTEY